MERMIEIKKVDLVDGEEMMDLAKKVQTALYASKSKVNKSLYLMGIYKDHVVVRDFEDGKMFRMKLSRNKDGDVNLDGLEEVKQVFVPITKAQWSRAFINDLPDSAFLYIEPGGKKDESGKTEPRSLRHFPVKDQAGKLDLPHLRNAIARVPVSNLPASIKTRVQAEARKMLEEAQKRTEKAAELPIRIARLPDDLHVVLEDGKLDADGVALIEEVIKRQEEDDPIDEPIYVKVPSGSMWQGII